MDIQMFGIKEIYECVIKSTYDIEINNKIIKAGEPIVSFENLQIVNFTEIKNRVSAKGGYNNQSWVSWDSTKEERIDFSQGIFSKIHLAILGNSKINKKYGIEIPKYETGEISEDYDFVLKFNPIKDKVFVYNADTGENINFSLENNKIIFNKKEVEPYTNIQVYYNFIYDECDVISVGKSLINGFLQLTAKVKMKNDMNGKIVTGVINIPKMKLMSDFSIRLGNDAPPAIGYFSVIGYPVGSKGSNRVMDFIMLNDDIDSDF